MKASVRHAVVVVMVMVVAVLVELLMTVEAKGLPVSKDDCKTKQKLGPGEKCSNAPCEDIEAGPRRNACFGDLLFSKIRRNNMRKLKKLLHKLEGNKGYLLSHTIKSGPRTGYTALLLAAERNNTEIVDLLLDAGSLVNHASAKGHTALYLLSRNGNIKCVKELLDKLANPNTKTTEGYTPVIMASWNRYPEVVKLLLEHKANPNVTTEKTKYSALYLSARNGDLDIVKYLVDAGAFVNVATSWNVTSLHVATYWGHEDIVAHLLDHGADPNVQEKDGYTVLHKALYYNHSGIVDLLLAHGALVDTQSNNGYTALIQAVRSGVPAMVQSVVGAKPRPSPNLCDNTGRTALHWAAKTRGMEIVKAILKLCPDLTIQDFNGHTPVDLARRHNTPTLVKMLEGFEANNSC